MGNIWFESWDSIIRIICVTLFAYVAVVVLLRISGKRTLSKMNGFDFVVTIALGSVLATVSLNENIPLANGVTAMVTFIGFQFIFTWLSVRMKSFKTLITSSPTLIFYKGDFLLQTMKKERVTEQEVYCAARKMGISSLDGVDMIILETTGDIAIVEKVSNRKEPIFEDVQIQKTNDL